MNVDRCCLDCRFLKSDDTKDKPLCCWPDVESPMWVRHVMALANNYIGVSSLCSIPEEQPNINCPAWRPNEEQLLPPLG